MAAVQESETAGIGFVADLFPPSHAELVERASQWLRSKGCKIVLMEYTDLSEQPDAIGWRGRTGVSYLIECKSTRADFLADKRKPFRLSPRLGVGMYRYYLCPPGMIQPEDLPAGWGLLYCKGKTISLEVGADPLVRSDWRADPFLFRPMNERGERIMLLSALRRCQISMGAPQLDRMIHAPLDERVAA